MVGTNIKSQLLVIGCFVLIITSVSTLLINTNLGNASVFCVDKFDHTNVVPCSNQNTIDIPTSDQQANGPTNMTASNMTSSISASPTLLQTVKFLLEDPQKLNTAIIQLYNRTGVINRKPYS